MKLILASSSPRRIEILRNAGFTFDVRAPQIDESPLAGESVEAMVTRLSEAKARAVADIVSFDLNQVGERAYGTIVIGADTAVELDGAIFGKPPDADHAREMLTALNGRTHRVLTGICAVRLPANEMRSIVESTNVTFENLSPIEIEAYVATGEPLGKAGAYAIQGLGGRYIKRIEGCYFNVVGLPLPALYRMLNELEVC